MNYLCENINLPTHPLRQNLEQKQRKVLHKHVLDEIMDGDIDFAERPLGDFVESYVNYLQSYIENWNDFRDEGIIGDAGNLDNKPEIMLRKEEGQRQKEIYETQYWKRRTGLLNTWAGMKYFIYSI